MNNNQDSGGGGDIVIGVSVALTGGLAGLGAGIQDATRVAETQINQAGLLGSRKIKFNIVDDASDKNAVIGVVDGLVQSGVPAIIGPLSSGQVNNVQATLLQKKVVELSATATSPALTSAQPAKDRYFFRTAPADDFQGKAVTKFIYDGVATAAGDAGMAGGGCRKASLVNGDDTYGNALGGVVKSTFTAKGGAIVTEDKVATTLASDYKAVAAKIVTAHPDCLVAIVYSDVAAQLLRDLKTAIAADTTADWSKFFVSGSDGEFDAAFIPAGQKDPADPTSENSAAGTFGTSPDPAPDTPEYKAFRNLWQQTYPGKEPAAYAANQYDAAMLIALAIQQAGSATDTVKIRDALYSVSKTGQAFGPAQFGDAVAAVSKGIDIDYKGASGPVDFDDYGNVQADYIIWHVEKKADGTYGYATIGNIKATELQ